MKVKGGFKNKYVNETPRIIVSEDELRSLFEMRDFFLDLSLKMVGRNPIEQLESKYAPYIRMDAEFFRNAANLIRDSYSVMTLEVYDHEQKF